MTIKKIVHQYY